jgi:spermidine/putrescine ABC transporter ATP-binding subunit
MTENKGEKPLASHPGIAHLTRIFSFDIVGPTNFSPLISRYFLAKTDFTILLCNAELNGYYELTGKRSITMRPAEHSSVHLLIEDLHKHYGSVRALDGADLAVNRGEFITLLGPSGSGKTTLLMAVAGFIFPTSGKIILDGEDLTRIPPYNRGLGMVFQDYALFPHMNVFDNIAFPLKLRKVDSQKTRKLVEETLELVKLQGMSQRIPSQLSGGQQQRVALGRALVFRPNLLLMDEPLGALDRKLREEMQIELKHIQQQVGITVLSVTHDQEEALTLSDRIAVIKDGRIEQIGTSHDIYERPASRFVAHFIGETNFLQVEVETIGNEYMIVKNDAISAIKVPRINKARVGDRAHLSVRPEKI